MKLRTEALTLRKRDGNVSDSPTSSTKFDKSSRSLSLPSIDPSVAQKLRISKLKKQKTAGDYVPGSGPSQDKLMEQMSNSFDIDFSLGGFPDRHEIQHPTNLCVRCSSDAAICMKCTELLVEKGVNFYRQTRAKGASMLFTSALAQVGITKLAKFMIFRSWHNGFESRQKLAKRKQLVVDKFFSKTGTYGPFQAWRRFVKMNIDERTAKAQEEMIERLHYCEDKIKELDEQNSMYKAKLDTISQSSMMKDRTIAEQATRINVLEKELKADKKRVIGLTGLVNPLRHLRRLMKDLIESQNSSIRKSLISASHIAPAHIYSNIMDEEFLKELHSLGSGEEADGNRLEKLLLKWVNTLSQNLSIRMDKTSGQGVDTYLPAFREVNDLIALSDGDHICRVIASLLFTKIDANHEVVTASERGVQFHGDDTNAFDVNELHSWFENIKKIRYGRTKQQDLLTTSLSAASKVLGLASFRADSIISCKTAKDSTVICSLLAQLMLASLPAEDAAQHAYCDRLSTEYDSSRQQLLSGLSERNAIIELQESYGRLSMLAIRRKKDEKQKKAAAAQAKKSKQSIVERLEEANEKARAEGDEGGEKEEKSELYAVEGEGKEKGEVLDGEVNEGSYETKEGKVEVEEEKKEGEDTLKETIEDEKEEEPAPPPSELLYPPDITALEENEYTKLTDLIDAYLKNNKEQKLMWEDTDRLQSAIHRSLELRDSLDDTQYDRERDIRVGVDIRQYILQGTYKSVITKLGW